MKIFSLLQKALKINCRMRIAFFLLLRCYDNESSSVKRQILIQEKIAHEKFSADKIAIIRHAIFIMRRMNIFNVTLNALV